jgi:hypothetical protein
VSCDQHEKRGNKIEKPKEHRPAQVINVMERSGGTRPALAVTRGAPPPTPVARAGLQDELIKH